jgi:sugar phosphate isomerase/epimerase
MSQDATQLSRREALGLLAAGAFSASVSGSAAVVVEAKVAHPPLTLVSRHLQWTDAEHGIEVAQAAGFDGIAWTVRRGAHIEPADVRRALPRIVKLTQAAGLATPMIITGLGSASALEAESILGTLAECGITRYRLGAPRYDYSRDIDSQFGAFRKELEAFVALNQRFGTTALFHTHSYANTIGGSVWDLWMLMRDLDPRFVGINYDIAHVMAKGGAGWRESSLAAHRHIHALSVKDFRWVKRAGAQAGEWPWHTEFVAPGEGMVNFTDFFRYFRSIEFSGPIEVYCEYKVSVPGRAQPVDMLGTDYRKWQLEMSPDLFISYLRRDADFYKQQLVQAGFPAAD